MVEARRNVTLLFWTGLVIAMVGGFLAALMWPGWSDRGNLALSIACAVVGQAGFLLMWVALVAWGVRFGIESADRR